MFTPHQVVGRAVGRVVHLVSVVVSTLCLLDHMVVNKCREHQNASDFDVAVAVQTVPDVSQANDIDHDSVDQPHDDETASVALMD